MSKNLKKGVFLPNSASYKLTPNIKKSLFYRKNQGIIFSSVENWGQGCPKELDAFEKNSKKNPLCNYLMVCFIKRYVCIRYFPLNATDLGNDFRKRVDEWFPCGRTHQHEVPKENVMITLQLIWLSSRFKANIDSHKQKYLVRNSFDPFLENSNVSYQLFVIEIMLGLSQEWWRWSQSRPSDDDNHGDRLPW